MSKFFEILWVIGIIISIGIVVTGNDARFTNEVKGFIANISFDGDNEPLDISNITPTKPEEKQFVFPKKAVIEVRVFDRERGEYDHYWYESKLSKDPIPEGFFAKYVITKLIVAEESPFDHMTFTDMDNLGFLKRDGDYLVQMKVDGGKILEHRASIDRIDVNRLSMTLMAEDIAK